MKFHKSYLSVLFALFFVQFIVVAQQRTGNIVEYFGKEKVNEISEGKLVHVFKTGLALKVQSLGFNSASFPKDPVYSQFVMNENKTVKEGDVFDVDYLGNEMVWKKISVDETSTFNDRSLRSSYVYLTYKSSSEKVVIFEASGHSLVTINGYPHEGDHYDFGHNLIPLKLKKGVNIFVLKVGRFPRIRARLLAATAPVQFTTRDVTMPDLLVDNDQNYVGGIRVVNTAATWAKGFVVTSTIEGKDIRTNVPDIAPMSVRKIPIEIGSLKNGSAVGKIEMKLSLTSKKGVHVDSELIQLQVKSKYKHHKKTFISSIDGSVQYYSVAPSLDKETGSQALFLSVHGASVEAVNQANAYKQKDWGNVVAPTNRRPFGFAWEDWGRLDALEVLEDAKSIFKPNKQRIYLTGHSMGGHGTWYLGATYPDHFAAIAPAAGYPDLLLYRDSFMKRTLSMPAEQLKRFGLTPEIVNRMQNPPTPTLVENMMTKAGTPSRTLKLIRNYLHLGVYLLHGEKDNVVPTFLARDMRERLGKFHNDFTYYEYPDGTHWYGDHSVDWKPIFDFFKARTIKAPSEQKKLEFYTGSPGVSATSNFVTIHQQEKAFEISSFTFSKENGYVFTTDNVKALEFDFSQLKDTVKSVTIDAVELDVLPHISNFLTKSNGIWALSNSPLKSEKGPHRNGGFKDAFRNNVVFVYATKGSHSENEWYFNRAKFDAEKFWYRANGNIEIIRDVDFKPENYVDRNVILYGNKDNNAAWKKLLNEQPIQVSNNVVKFGNKVMKGNQWGMFFIVPRKDSDMASIGVVSATGNRGMKASYMNHYLVNGTTFPDVVIFDDSVLKEGSTAVKCAGFFGNDWSIENGEFEWK